MEDSRDENIWKGGEMGTPGELVDKKTGLPVPEKLTNDSGFTHYDSSGGACGLCGRYTCNGGCFK